MKFIIDNKIPFIDGVLEPFGEVKYLQGAKITHEKIKDTNALIVRTRTNCNSELLDNTPVQFIATATIGFDHIDTEYCETRNITWQNAPGCNSYSVQQYIASALLTIAENEKIDLTKKTIGIVGVGNVGSKVAKFAKILGMKVLLNDPPRAAESAKFARNSVSIEQIKNEADFITFHVPLNRSGEYPTYHMVDSDFLQELSDSERKLWILNSSRGEVVDNQALKKALQSGPLAGALLDVWENEPNIDRELMQLAKFATPHIAGYSADGKANGTAASIQGVSRFFNLGIDNWEPVNVPRPDNYRVTIECSGKTFQEVLKEAIDATYKIGNDDLTLRKSPETFEKQRGDYPLRREPPAFEITLTNCSANFAEKLEALRFCVSLQ